MDRGIMTRRGTYTESAIFMQLLCRVASNYDNEATVDQQFEEKPNTGYQFCKGTFFLADGTPRYYDYKTLPIDIQCSSQAIGILVCYNDRDPRSLPLALNVVMWAIEKTQDRIGYFYYRRYSPWLVNKTPTLHQGQGTMRCALARLFKLL